MSVDRLVGYSLMFCAVAMDWHAIAGALLMLVMDYSGAFDEERAL